MEYDFMAHIGLLVESRMGDTWIEMITTRLPYSVCVQWTSRGHRGPILWRSVQYTVIAAGEFIIIRTNPHPNSERSTDPCVHPP